MRWRIATASEILTETPRAATLRLDVPGWPGHRAGQHIDVRLTAEDGYSAQRSYSIASPPNVERIDLTVARIDDGEVSPYLTLELAVGDPLEVQGPIGGYFVWDAADTTPVLLVAGGSGIVPLMAMLRHNVATGNRAPMRLVYSARNVDDVLYRAELDSLAADDAAAVIITLTRDPPPKWTGRRGRVDRDLLGEVGWPPSSTGPRCYVCGPTPFVEAVARALVAIGHEPSAVRTERFGPSGG